MKMASMKITPSDTTTLSTGPLDTAAFDRLVGSLRLSTAPLDETLFSDASAIGGSATLDLRGISTPACLGLNLYVRDGPDASAGDAGPPATGQLTRYLTMAAHAIVARIGAECARVVFDDTHAMRICQNAWNGIRFLSTLGSHLPLGLRSHSPPWSPIAPSDPA